MKELDIVRFAKIIMGKKLLSYEVERLRNYEGLREWSSYDEWIKPASVGNQYLYEIWLEYQKYMNEVA